MKENPAKMNVESYLELHAIIHGRVQGVGFRATTRHYALQLGLKGTVRNLPNGSVEIRAQGSKEALERLLHKLKHESRPASIDKLELNYYDPKDRFEDFKILH